MIHIIDKSNDNSFLDQQKLHNMKSLQQAQMDGYNKNVYKP